MYSHLYNVPKWLVKEYFTSFPSDSISSKLPSEIQLTPSVTGTIGDTFGGTLSPIIGIIAAYLTFLAFWIQYRANEQQKRQIKQQGFEDTFFRLLDSHQKIVSSIDIRDSNDVSKINASGHECFKSMYNKMRDDLKGETDITHVEKIYDETQDFYKHDLHHYFRFLYHVLKFIKKSEISDSEKFKYASILRATLSAYELTFIFYNGLHDFGNSHFKPLLEDFSFLKNMDDSLLFNIEQKKRYEPLAFASSSQRKEILFKK